MTEKRGMDIDLRKIYGAAWVLQRRCGENADRSKSGGDGAGGPAGFGLGGTLGFVAVVGEAAALALVSAVGESEADLGELELIATVGEGGGEVGVIQGQGRPTGFVADDGEQVFEGERAFGVIEEGFAGGEEAMEAAGRSDGGEGIDDVLGDGLFPDLKVELRTPLFRPNQAGGYQPVDARGKIPDLFVNPNAVDPALTIIHESGHLLDNLGLHTPSRARNYASKGQPQLADLMKTIRRSVAAGRLAGEVGNTSSLLSSQELFARAYAQFIAQQSGDERLAETIKAIRLGELRETGLYKNSQWTRADFQAISQALELLLKSLGWIPAQ